MKQHVLAATIVALFVVLFALFSITPTPTDSVHAAPADTNTPTVTPSPTPTLTATSGPCGGPPAAPLLKSPNDGRVLPYNQTGVTLKWNAVDCATSYRVRILIGGKHGTKLAGKKNYHKLKFVVTGLTAGQSYSWFAQACDDAGCTPSDYNQFQVHAAPPRPTTPPQPTSTPATNQNPHIAVYKGPSVYLNDIPTVYYFDCGGKWVSLGGDIYFVVDGFTPGEVVKSIGYEISSGPPPIIENTGYYIADGGGQVRTVVDTSPLHGGHYHFIFTGQSSKKQYCGHFDLPKPKH